MMRTGALCNRLTQVSQPLASLALAYSVPRLLAAMTTAITSRSTKSTITTSTSRIIPNTARALFSTGPINPSMCPITRSAAHSTPRNSEHNTAHTRLSSRRIMRSARLSSVAATIPRTSGSNADQANSSSSASATMSHNTRALADNSPVASKATKPSLASEHA